MADPVDGVLEDDSTDASNLDWVEFFRRQGKYYDAARSAIADAITVGIRHGVVHVDYVSSNIQITLPKVWIEQQLGQRLPL